MYNKQLLAAAITFALSVTGANAQKTWTLEECIDYAMANNIQIKQRKISASSSHEDVQQSRSSLLPSASFSTNQNTSWRPFAESTINLTNGSMTTSSNSMNYNGMYSFNAQWTVWNGHRTHNNIKQNELTEQMNELQTEQTANSIQEQIAQLYVQVLYENEAVRVCEQIVKASELQRDRAKTMVEVGTLARVDLVQLEAQVSQDMYSLTNAKTQLANYKLKLKQLLEIHDNESFEVAIPDVNDETVLSPLPNLQTVYLTALSQRPEIKSGKLNIESSQVAIATAKAGYLPTVSLSASIGTSNNDAARNPFFQQLKNNLGNSVGISVSVPIYDQRQTRTNINKAEYALEANKLNLQDQQKQLFSTIEDYYLNATTSQQQFIYAKANVRSMTESYNLISEQFRLGLKNIVELTTGKNNLLQAEQQLLQTKYTALLNQAMLRFYAGDIIKL